MNGDEADGQQKLEVTVKARMYHARLLSLADEVGGIEALSKKLGMSSATVGAWIRMDSTPIPSGTVRRKRLSPRTYKAVKTLCRLCKCKVTDLWPEWFGGMVKLRKRVEFTRSVDAGVLLSDLRPKDQPVALIAGPVEMAEQNEEREQAPETLRRLMECLPDRLKTVVSLRQLDGATFEQAGMTLGISKERVRQLEIRAMNKLRDAAKKEMSNERR